MQSVHYHATEVGISIIMSVRNATYTIRDCIDSILSQSYCNVSSMKSEQGWLRVNRSRDIDTRFLWETAVCGDCTQEIDNKIIEAPMP